MGIVLAQYTIRSKQDYIFRSNQIVEIIGGSDNISRSWDILFEQAKKSGIKEQQISGDITFSLASVLEGFRKGNLQMVELFRGGGNDTVLFDDKTTFYKANCAFSYHLLRNYPGMIPMAVCTPFTGDYRKDYDQLMCEADQEKRRMTDGQGAFVLPFSMMDRNTFQPYSRVIHYDGRLSRVTEDAYSKRMSGIAITRKDPKVKILDTMVTKKGEESLLAVVHADGNNMGAKIQEMLGAERSYDACVGKMRIFTRDTDRAFNIEGLAALEGRQRKLMREQEEAGKRVKEEALYFRRIISDGDDMTFVCNARYALTYTRAYLEAVQEYQIRHNSQWAYSSCAGICIFHSHYPFALAYKMAEQACDDGAKSMVHGTGSICEESWVDFHYVHQGIGGNLTAVRDIQGTADRQARPWRVAGGTYADSRGIETMYTLLCMLKEYKVSRSDLKTVSGEFESSFSDAERELVRIYGHHKGLQAKLENYIPDRWQLLRVMYDLTEMYDLWFA